MNDFFSFLQQVTNHLITILIIPYSFLSVNQFPRSVSPVFCFDAVICHQQADRPRDGQKHRQDHKRAVLTHLQQQSSDGFKQQCCRPPHPGNSLVIAMDIADFRRTVVGIETGRCFRAVCHCTDHDQYDRHRAPDHKCYFHFSNSLQFCG